MGSMQPCLWYREWDGRDARRDLDVIVASVGWDCGAKRPAGLTCGWSLRAMEVVVSAATSNVDWADDTSSSAVDAAKARVSVAHTPNFFCAYALNDLASFLLFCRSA